MRQQRLWGKHGAALIALGVLLFAGALTALVEHGASTTLNLVIGVEIATAGLAVVGSARPGKELLTASRLAGAIAVAGAAVIAFGVLAPREAVDSALAELLTAKVKTTGGFGPARRPFRCTEPTRCDGPRYVVFNSYLNNPKIRREQPFFAFTDREHPHENTTDSIDLGSGGPSVLTLRAFIDNDTYQQLEDLSTTDALDTHLRLALPHGPVYETFPTLYLYASNARPKLVWDTVLLRSDRPTLLTYVPGSARLYRRNDQGRFTTTSLSGTIASGTGLDLGRWPADFRYSGFVTFKLRAVPLNEPVRDPRATRAVVPGQVEYLPPTHHGIAAEPVRDDEAREQFRCSPTRCNGPPFPTLDAYKNQPLLGDEADFIRAANGSEWSDKGFERYRTVAVVHPGDELKVRVSIDNSADPTAVGAPPLPQLVARDVLAHVFVPRTADRSLTILAAVHAANARPKTIVDGLPVRSSQPVRLEARPETLGVLTAAGLRRLPHGFFTSLRGLFSPGQLGIRVAKALPPSFSKVLYVEFYVRVRSG
jgi:hypothetical protein